MNRNIKRFFESHIDLIENNNLKEFFKLLIFDDNSTYYFDNLEALEIVSMLQTAKIPYESARQEALLDILKILFKEMSPGSGKSAKLSDFIDDHTNNTLGYSVSEIAEIIEKYIDMLPIKHITQTGSSSSRNSAYTIYF